MDVTHIERPPLPWRAERATECGLDADRHATWTREAAIAEMNKLGEQRFALFVCMTCWQTARRHSTWDENPVSCLERYCLKFKWEREPEKARRRRFADELRAVGLLVEAHREEFDRLVDGLGDTSDLGDRRAARRYRREIS